MSVHYRVGISEASAHLVDVTLQISDPDPQGQLLTLPNWIPGSYMIRDFSRNIVSISASSGEAPVSLQKQDKSSWKAQSGLSELTLNYQVYAWDLSVRAAHVDQTHAFLNGTSIFLCVEGQEHDVHDVMFERPLHDTAMAFQLSTAMQSVDIDASGYGRYATASYDELIDHPVEQGTFNRLEFQACGVAHEVVLTGAGYFDEERLMADLKRICEYQIRLFGEPAPVDRYIFQVMVVENGYGGLEHRASTALLITRENLPVAGEAAVSDKYLNFLGLCSHEYFHTWNVKRIKPARYVPYELQAESYSELLWFFEGMTSYYDDLVLVRTGLIDPETYLGLLSKTLTRVQRGAGRLTQTVTESSFDAWHKFYKQDENAPNAIVSYYAKGSLIALCLDALLRKHTKGKMSLDTLMRILWNRWLATQEGLQDNEPQALAAELVDADLTEFFDQVLYSTDELPVEYWLEKLGVSLEWCERLSGSDMGGGRPEPAGGKMNPPQKVKPWLGANVNDTAGGVQVMQVMRGGPAEMAGLSAGDVIVAMNNLSVNKLDVDNHLARYANLESMPVHYFRLGHLYEAQLPILPARKDTAVLSVRDETLLKAWIYDPRLAADTLEENHDVAGGLA